MFLCAYVGVVDIMHTCLQCGVCCFFFQAEDGIRDLVRSRGLGDVYKRQVSNRGLSFDAGHQQPESLACCIGARHDIDDLALVPVSYTHLTLPTSDLV
mgnify:CR=1 FL=1